MRATAPHSLPRRPRLKQTTEVLRGDDGCIYLLRAASESDFSVSDTPQVRALLELLDGRRTSAEVSSALQARNLHPGGDELDVALGELSELGLIEDASHDDRLPAGGRRRYERQLRYFGDLAPAGADRTAFQRRLAEARVVLLGVGGLGTWAAYGLACAGVGRLDLVDGDRVEISNLNRQILFTEADVGAEKAPAAARALRAFNSSIEVRAISRRVGSAAEVAQVVQGADFVLDAADFPPHLIERWVNGACFAGGIPFMTMSQYPPYARVGPMYVPGRTGCVACQERAYRSSSPLYDALVAQRSATESPAATFGPACGLIASQAVIDVVHHLTGLCRPASEGRALMIDLRTLELDPEPVKRIAGCEVCGR